MPGDRLRGGKIGRRDKYYWLRGRPEFEDFWRWWHKAGKDNHGGFDIQGRREAHERFDEWVSDGRPTVKLGADHG